MQKTVKYLLKSREPLLLALALALLILPNVLTIFVLNYNLFISLDWVKLVLLSASLSLPLLLVNAIWISEVEKLDPDDSKGFVQSFVLGAIATGFLLFCMLPVYYFFLNSFLQYLVLVSCGEVVVLATIWLEGKRESRK